MEENRKIFVDSNYFVALFNDRDALFQIASDIATRLGAAKIITSNFIFLETVTVLSQRRGQTLALAAGEYLLNNPLIEIMQIDYNLQQDTWEIFKDLKLKNTSFVDASVIAVMQAESLEELLTFDLKDFKLLARKYNFKLVT